MWVSVVSNVDLFLLYTPQCYRRQHRLLAATAFPQEVSRFTLEIAKWPGTAVTPNYQQGAAPSCPFICSTSVLEEHS